MQKIIDEIREITAGVVAKKQDSAKANYPKLIEKIKGAASLGYSECRINESEMNEYDKRLLQQDGFTVYLIDKAYNNSDHWKDTALSQFGFSTKEWVIKW